MPSHVGQDRSGFRFNPLWLLDLMGLAGAGLFVALAVAPWVLPGLLKVPFVAELALAVAAVALTVRLIDAVNRARATRDAARAELQWRLEALDEALLDLRRSLSREAARRFIERRDAFAVGLDAALPRLEPSVASLAHRSLELCAGLTGALANSIPRRAAIVSAAYRLGQEIDRAGRRGELDPYAAGDLRALIDDALGVMDEALYAEWNADHFGRLGAVQRHFGRRIERRDGETVRLIDREAAALFDGLVGHLREKVALVDVLVEWEAVRAPLAHTLSGFGSAARPQVRSPQGLGRERSTSLDARFALVPLAVARTDDPGPRRLSAAND